MINSRPLTYQKANPNDTVLLTPNHFLIGQIRGVILNLKLILIQVVTLKSVAKNSRVDRSFLEWMDARMGAKPEF